MQSAEGGCLCLAVRYRVSGVPLSSIVCHCNSCRKASAAPAVGWVTFDRKKFALLRGELSSFQSSPGVLRTICRLCGSPLTYARDESPNTVDVTTASLDHPEVWLEYKVSWEATNRGIGQYPRGSGGGPYEGT